MCSRDASDHVTAPMSSWWAIHPIPGDYQVRVRSSQLDPARRNSPSFTGARAADTRTGNDPAREKITTAITREPGWAPRSLRLLWRVNPAGRTRNHAPPSAHVR